MRTQNESSSAPLQDIADRVKNVGIGDESKPCSFWTKRHVRIVIDLVHILLIFILLICAILAFISIQELGSRTLWVLYLAPLIVCTILLETFHLTHGYTPKWVAEKLGILVHLGPRAFLYQIAAACALGVAGMRPRCGYQAYAATCHSDPGLQTMEDLADFVWRIGVALFVLAWVAKKCEFTDWIEEPVEGTGDPNPVLIDVSLEGEDARFRKLFASVSP